MTQATASECDKALNGATDILAARVGPTAPRAWQQLLIYCPDWIVLDRAKKIKNRNRKRKHLSS